DLDEEGAGDGLAEAVRGWNGTQFLTLTIRGEGGQRGGPPVRRDSPDMSPQREAAAQQVRTAISGALRRLYEHDQAQPLPDHLARLLGRLDDATARSEGGPAHDRAPVADQGGRSRGEGVS